MTRTSFKAYEDKIGLVQYQRCGLLNFRGSLLGDAGSHGTPLTWGGPWSTSSTTSPLVPEYSRGIGRCTACFLSMANNQPSDSLADAFKTSGRSRGSWGR